MSENILDSHIRDIPVGYLKRTLQIASAQGYHTGGIMEKFELDAKILSSSSNRIRLSVYYSIIDYVIYDLKIPGFGLMQGKAEKIRDHLFLGGAVNSSENLHDALTVAVKYQHVFGVPKSYSFHIGSSTTSIICKSSDHTARERWAVENVLSGWVNIIRMVLNRKDIFSSLNLDYEDPGYTELYEEVFECQVNFEKPVCALRFPSLLLNVPISTRNPAVHQLCINQIEEIISKFEKKQSLVDQIEAIALSNTMIIPTLSQVADQLFMSQRTLHRRLKAEGTSYRKIVDGVRRKLALEFLTETNLSPKEIGYNLAYTEPANFYHAFRRWYACTPLQYRERSANTK
jgi:AraC-like DNA-binding protein